MYALCFDKYLLLRYYVIQDDWQDEEEDDATLTHTQNMNDGLMHGGLHDSYALVCHTNDRPTTTAGRVLQ